jgi:hypothetical protein
MLMLMVVSLEDSIGRFPARSVWSQWPRRTLPPSWPGHHGAGEDRLGHPGAGLAVVEQLVDGLSRLGAHRCTHRFAQFVAGGPDLRAKPDQCREGGGAELVGEGVEVAGLGRGHGGSPGGVVDDEHMNALFAAEAKRFVNLHPAPGLTRHSPARQRWPWGSHGRAVWRRSHRAGMVDR